MNTETIYERANYLVNSFDFATVQKMMTAVDWRWAGPYMNGKFGLPTIDAMRSQARDLILEAYGLDTNCSAGGFEAFWARDSYVALRFIAAEVRHRDV
jgi:hypothetical protein